MYIIKCIYSTYVCVCRSQMSAKYFTKCASSVASGGNAAGSSTSVAAVASWLLFLTCFFIFVFLLLWLRAFWPGLALAFGCAFVASRWKAARDNGDKANVPSVKCSTLRLIYCVRCTVYRVLCTLCCAQPTHALWAYTRTHAYTQREERQTHIDTIIMQIYDFNTCNW